SSVSAATSRWWCPWDTVPAPPASSPPISPPVTSSSTANPPDHRLPREPTMTTGHTSPSESRTRIATTMGKARILIEAMPYIRRFAGETIVVKYGGSAMVDQALADSFAADITLLSLVGLHPVVVHGGGPQISSAMERRSEEHTSELQSRENL